MFRGEHLADKKVLLEVTENHLNTGLRGVPVGTCRTSYVTPTEGVHYCGYPISELAQFDPEDIVTSQIIIWSVSSESMEEKRASERC